MPLKPSGNVTSLSILTECGWKLVVGMGYYVLENRLHFVLSAHFCLECFSCKCFLVILLVIQETNHGGLQIAALIFTFFSFYRLILMSSQLQTIIISFAFNSTADNLSFLLQDCTVYSWGNLNSATTLAI